MAETMLWSGRFSAAPDPEMIRLTRSVGIDMTLLANDLDATRAHAASLRRSGFLDAQQQEAIERECERIATDAERGTLEVRPEDEDVHSVVERELTERLGDTGRRIHAGRSRNDLVAADLRMWCKARCDVVLAQLAKVITTLAEIASEHAESVMPAYTHLQRAQPVSLGFHLLAHATALTRDHARFEDAREAADLSTLGAGAVAGTTLPLDPDAIARDLGFARTFDNAMDAVADRDFACDLLYASAMCAVHLSRLAEEIVLWTTSEYGFARLADEWSTGSSMMPQKRNPDLAELVRGRSAAHISDLNGLLILLKGLPLAYQRDLQEDKSFVFQAGERITDSLIAVDKLLNALSFDLERMEGAVRESATWATDVAEALVKQGLPFRLAHETAGRVVAAVEGAPIAQGDDTSTSAFALAERLRGDPLASVRARAHAGGTSPHRVLEHAARLRRRFASSAPLGPAPAPTAVRHLLTMTDVSPAEIVALLRSATAMKAHPHRYDSILRGRRVVSIYEHPSTRTRVSFDAAVTSLGGSPITMQGSEMQLGRGETVADTARCLSRYADAIVIRAKRHGDVVDLAAAATVPVVNALTDREHPCQALADLLTIQERFGGLRGVTLAYLGDGNNVATSLVLAGAAVGMHVRLACPAPHALDDGVLVRARNLAAASGGSVETDEDVERAVVGAQVLYTDVWTSMGCEDEREERLQTLAPYRLDGGTLALAEPDAIVMHCLPAHRGEEIAEEVIDGERSVVWDQAENRMHVQKAILARLIP